MRLLGVELTRYRSRRAVLLLMVLCVVAAALMAGVRVYETRPVSAADLAHARAQADHEAAQPYIKHEIAQCQKHPRRYGGPGVTDAQCRHMITPRPEWVLYREQLQPGGELQNGGPPLVVILAGLLILAAMTFAGADWSSGSMSNQLLFESRRVRVWSAKLLAVALWSALTAAVCLLLFWGTITVIADQRGIEIGAHVQSLIRWQGLRGVALIATTAVGGYALTMLLRSTVGSVGVLFAYAVGGEILISLIPVVGVGKLSLANNVDAWIKGVTSFWDDSLTCPRGGNQCDKTTVLSQAHGAVFLGLLLAVVLVLSVLAHRRRDVP